MCKKDECRNCGNCGKVAVQPPVEIPSVEATESDAVNSVLSAAATTLNVEGIYAAAGSAFLDIPHTYDNSSADIGRTTLTIHLRSPGGDPRSMFQHIGIQLCAILGLAVPLSTGKQSYTQPMLLEWFDQGRSRVSLGAVESLTIRRGVDARGWTGTGRYFGVDVDINLVNLTKILHMPISAGFSLSNAAVSTVGSLGGQAIAMGADVLGIGDNNTQQAIINGGVAAASALMPSSYDADNLYTEFFATLASLGMHDQIGKLRRLRLRLTEQMGQYNQWKSPARHLSYWMDGHVGDVIKLFNVETARN